MASYTSLNREHHELRRTILHRFVSFDPFALCLSHGSIDGIGMVADFVRNYFNRPRSFCITVVAAIFIISQVTCYYVQAVENLWKASALLGLAYGCMFGLFPTICIEWFGLRTYPCFSC